MTNSLKSTSTAISLLKRRGKISFRRCSESEWKTRAVGDTPPVITMRSQRSGEALPGCPTITPLQGCLFFLTRWRSSSW